MPTNVPAPRHLPDTATLPQRFKDLIDACLFARDQSKLRTSPLYVVASPQPVINPEQPYIVDDCGFVRVWETLCKTFVNGKEVKD